MPRITVQSLRGKTLDQKRELARRITDATVEIFQVLPEIVTVKFEEHGPEDIAKAGVLTVDRETAPAPSS